MTDQRVALSASEMLSGLRTVQSVLAPDLSEDELRLFAMVANRSGLDPFAKQIYAVKRKGRVTFQTGIDGYRSIAARTGFYDGQDEPEYGPVCDCKEAPAGHPVSATVRVYRKGVSRAIAASAHWHEYKPGDNDFMWVRMPRVMIAKVAEALALRKAFPYDPENRQGIGADVYTADEMAQADRHEPTPLPPRLTLAEKAATLRATIAPEAAGATVSTWDGTEAVLAQPMTEEASDAMPYGEVDIDTGRDGMTAAEFVEGARRAAITKLRIAGALDCLPADITPRITAMSDAERWTLAQSLGIR